MAMDDCRTSRGSLQRRGGDLFGGDGFDALRVSPNVMNTTDELDRFVAALRGV